MSALSLDGAIEHGAHLLAGAVNGFLHGFVVMAHTDGRPVADSCFDGALLVLASALAAIGIGKMHFDSRQVAKETFEVLRDEALDAGLQRFAALDVIVGVELNLHGVFLGTYGRFAAMGWKGESRKAWVRVHVAS